MLSWNCFGFGGYDFPLFHVGSIVSGILGFLIVNEGGALGYLVGYVTAGPAQAWVSSFFGWTRNSRPSTVYRLHQVRWDC